MAIARLSVKVGKPGHAAAHAAYVARAGDYANLKGGERLEAVESGNMPPWAADHLRFWQAADAHERKNGSTYREMEIALPRELSPAERLALVRGFVAQELGEAHAYTFGIHCPRADDGGENPHVHLMFSERRRDGIERDPAQYFKRHNAKNPERGGLKKGWGQRPGQTLTAAERAAELRELRARWEAACNAALEAAGRRARIDMRSYQDQGLDIPPVVKSSAKAWRDEEGRQEIREARAARADAVAAALEEKAALAGLRGIDFGAELARMAAKARKDREDREAEEAARKAAVAILEARKARPPALAPETIQAHDEAQERRERLYRAWYDEANRYQRGKFDAGDTSVADTWVNLHERWEIEAAAEDGPGQDEDDGWGYAPR